MYKYWLYMWYPWLPVAFRRHPSNLFDFIWKKLVKFFKPFDSDPPPYPGITASKFRIPLDPQHCNILSGSGLCHNRISPWNLKGVGFTRFRSCPFICNHSSWTRHFCVDELKADLKPVRNLATEYLDNLPIASTLLRMLLDLHLIRVVLSSSKSKYSRIYIFHPKWHPFT